VNRSAGLDRPSNITGPAGAGGRAGGPPQSPRSVAARGTVIVSTVASDAHTWNLVLLQLQLEQLGYVVVNLGPCVPDDELVAECVRHLPALLVISSVNGHGWADGHRVIRKLRARPELADVPMVIGGKLGVSAESTVGADGVGTLGEGTVGEGTDARAAALLVAGFDAVFPDGQDADLCRYIELRRAAPARAGAL
jgi:methylaspartate mutase sigma subunit